MAEKSKDELVDEAKDLGISNPTKLTKPELQERLSEHDTSALGPYVPPGASQVPQFEQVGKITGATPLEENDIPAAGR